jgi:peptidoglycan/xylan/chitin deacetylase (PgdA/CDA1 family)
MHAEKNNAFGILMYHRVAPVVAGAPRPTWNVTPERFARQLRGLLSRGYRAWPLQRVLTCHRTGEPIPNGVFVVTFDDGYDAVYQNAWPILKQLSVPAIIFAVTSYLDARRPFVSDDWSAAGAPHVPTSTWLPLTATHCSEMLDHGLIEIGSHTHTHADFRDHPEAFLNDLVRSQEVLRDAFGVDQAAFAFPFGYYTAEMIAVARPAGLSCALNVDQELVSPRTDPFAWSRFNVEENDTPASLAFKLNGWYTAFRKAWHWLRKPWKAGAATVQPPSSHSCDSALRVRSADRTACL